jgi:hypothetical protein
MRSRIKSCSPLSRQEQKTFRDIWRRQVELNELASKGASELARFASLEEVLDYIHRLKEKPEWIEIKIEDGKRHIFAKPAITWDDPFLGQGYILSDGRIVLSLREYLGRDYYFSENLERRIDLKNCLFAGDELTSCLFPVPVPRCVLEPLVKDIVPKENFALIYQQVAQKGGPDERKSPCEILINETVSRIITGLYDLLQGGDLLYLIVLTGEISSLTLTELIERAPKVEKRTTRLFWGDLRYDPWGDFRDPLLNPYRYGRERTIEGELLIKLREAIHNFLSDFDGWEFTPFLRHRALSSTLRHAVYLGHCRPEERAGFLLEDIAQVLGFHCSTKGVWMKTDGRAAIEIHPNSTVFINGHMVCIVPRNPVSLPRGDLIAAKMIFLGTSLRDRIYTLAPYRDTLAQLFPEGEEALKGLDINHLKEVLNG